MSILGYGYGFGNSSGSPSPGNAYVDGGNAFGADAVLGLTDSNQLTIQNGVSGVGLIMTLDGQINMSSDNATLIESNTAVVISGGGSSLQVTDSTSSLGSDNISLSANTDFNILANNSSSDGILRLRRTGTGLIEMTDGHILTSLDNGDAIDITPGILTLQLNSSQYTFNSSELNLQEKNLIGIVNLIHDPNNSNTPIYVNSKMQFNYDCEFNTVLFNNLITASGGIKMGSGTTLVDNGGGGTNITFNTNRIDLNSSSTNAFSINNTGFSFWGNTPITQPTTAYASSSFTAGAGTPITDASTFGGYTIRQLFQILIDRGDIA